MAVLLETSRGDVVIDLFVDECPITCKNFLKLCKLKYYNNCIFHYVQRDFLVQTGDPTTTGKGGTSVYGMMYGEQARFFDDEIRPLLKHKVKGVVGMASPMPNANASQFYITTGQDMNSLDGKHTIFGKVGEGLDVLDKINEAFVDEAGRPLQNIRIRHTIILDDPFPDPPELETLIPPASPEPQFEQGDRLEDDWVPTEDTRDIEQIEEETRKADAHNRAVVLEMIGDLPEADVKPPSNVLFICKLNPVTTEEDLEIIFSRFGNVVDCSIIRDYKTGDSLCYGFIGFDNDASCEEAYFKMDNVLIDDRRIRVDFSQSVSHLWKQFKKGGKKGDAGMMQEADTHQRQPAGGKLEYKGQQLGGHMLGGRGAGRHQHQLLMDEDEPPQPPLPAQAPQQRRPDRPDHGGGGGPRGRDVGRDGHSGRERDRNGRSADRDQRDRHGGRSDVEGTRGRDGDGLGYRGARGGGREDRDRNRGGVGEREDKDRRDRDRGYDRHDERDRGYAGKARGRGERSDGRGRGGEHDERRDRGQYTERNGGDDKRGERQSGNHRERDHSKRSRSRSRDKDRRRRD